MNLADVFFKPMAGERERLLRTSAQPALTRRFFKRNARFVCPAPHAQLRDFYDWYLFWSSYPLPTDETQSFFVANSLDLFKKECKYVQHGQTSDLPGLDYYAIIGTTRGEFPRKKLATAPEWLLCRLPQFLMSCRPPAVVLFARPHHHMSRKIPTTTVLVGKSRRPLEDPLPAFQLSGGGLALSPAPLLRLVREARVAARHALKAPRAGVAMDD